MKSTNKEFAFMIVLNIIIVLSVMMYGLNNNGEQEQIVNYKTDTYVQYIEETPYKVLQVTSSQEASLSENTSDNVVTATDSCQDISEITEFTYSGISEKDKYLLAKINQCEAGNQNIKTRELVVLVILNRVNSDSFPDTIEKVIKENHNGVYQFSPLYKGGSWYCTEPTEDAYTAVENVINSTNDYSDGALYFESCKNKDNWHSRNLKFLYQSQDMRFYK